MFADWWVRENDKVDLLGNFQVIVENWNQDVTCKTTA